MAEPTDSYPESATNRAQKNGADGEGDGHAAIQDALAANGDRLAEVLDRSDEVEAALETAILVVATADEEEIDELTGSAANLIAAADGLSTEGTAGLATDLGENADDLADALELVVELQRDGHLDDLVALTTAVTDSLSAEEIERLSTMLSDHGPELVDALDAVIELQEAGELDALLDTATTLSALEIDEEAVQGLNDLLGAVGEARHAAEPVGLRGTLRRFNSRDFRASLGYLLALLNALGRRLRLG